MHDNWYDVLQPTYDSRAALHMGQDSVETGLGQPGHALFRSSGSDPL